VLIVHIEQGILLRTADDHSSNNVGHSHGGEQLKIETEWGWLRKLQMISFAQPLV
jgi:gluconate kinase